MSFQVLRPSVGANAPRWDGRSRGHYEVWYLTLSDPATGRGFWFRYTLEVPKDPAQAAVAELWGFAFTPGQPAIGGKHTTALDVPGGGVMQVGDAVFQNGRAVGRLPDVGLEWDLQWDPASTALWHIPAWPGRSKLPSTRVCSPTVDAAFDGEVTVAGETIRLAGALGSQTHLWGRQHAGRWAWGHCNAFVADPASENGGGSGGLENVILEAVYAVPLVAPAREAPFGFTLLYVEVDGRPVPCNAFPWVLGARSQVESPRWALHGRTREARVRAVLEADLGEMAQVTYEDPDGAKAWCANSEIARCALEVEWGDGRFQRFVSEGLAHVEFGAREPDPRVPVLC